MFLEFLHATGSHPTRMLECTKMHLAQSLHEQKTPGKCRCKASPGPAWPEPTRQVSIKLVQAVVTLLGACDNSKRCVCGTGCPGGEPILARYSSRVVLGTGPSGRNVPTAPFMSFLKTSMGTCAPLSVAVGT